MSHEDAVSELAGQVGLSGNWVDEHDRYRLYLSALDLEERWPELRECLHQDPDRTMARSVVVEAFERVPPSARRAWADLIDDHEAKDFLERRLLGHEILDCVQEDPYAEEGVIDRLDQVAHTFQRRVAATSRSRAVLEVLREHGSRRTRHLANERLRVLSQSDPRNAS